jgi:hypothetical protein
LQKFWVFSKNIETVNGTQCPNSLTWIWLVSKNIVKQHELEILKETTKHSQR